MSIVNKIIKESIDTTLIGIEVNLSGHTEDVESFSAWIKLYTDAPSWKEFNDEYALIEKAKEQAEGYIQQVENQNEIEFDEEVNFKKLHSLKSSADLIDLEYEESSPFKLYMNENIILDY